MINIILTILLSLFLIKPSIAGTVATCFDYNPGDSLTDVNLDCNLNNIRNELNGSLNNNNADTANGFRFYEILGALPANGTLGRTVFNTTTNLLYFDNGSDWIVSPAYTGTAVIGDTLYYDGTTWSRLARNTTATRYISNTGSSSVPAWAQVNIANGLTIASQATGDIIYASSATAWARLGVGSNGEVLELVSGVPSWESGSNIELFTSNGNFTAPAGITKVYLTMCGGGGGGAAGQQNVGAGGGGGGAECTLNYPYTVVPGNVYAVVVGGGGAGGDTNGENGAAGVASTFDSVVSLAGGNLGVSGGGAGGAAKGGAAAGVAGSGGGTGGAGGVFIKQISGAGGAGELGGGDRGGGGGGGTIFAAGGNGGDAPSSNGVAGIANTGTGGGGGGSAAGADGDGGNGGSGIVVVMY